MKRMRLVLFSMALLVTLFGLTAIVAYAQVTTHTHLEVAPSPSRGLRWCLPQ